MRYAFYCSVSCVTCVNTHQGQKRILVLGFSYLAYSSALFFIKGWYVAETFTFIKHFGTRVNKNPISFPFGTKLAFKLTTHLHFLSKYNQGPIKIHIFAKWRVLGRIQSSRFIFKSMLFWLLEFYFIYYYSFYYRSHNTFYFWSQIGRWCKHKIARKSLPH